MVKDGIGKEDAKQAVSDLYRVARQAQVSADVHEQVAQKAQELLEYIEPKKEK